MDKFLKILVIIFVSSTVLMSTVFVFVTIIPETKNTSDSDWTLAADYCQEWCDYEELNNMGCDQPILEHLAKYSNLLDEEFSGKYAMEDIGLSDGMSVEKFNECVDFIFEKRVSYEFDRTWGSLSNIVECFTRCFIMSSVQIFGMSYPQNAGCLFPGPAPYTLDWIGLADRIDPDDFDVCVKELLEQNPKELENED